MLEHPVVSGEDVVDGGWVGVRRGEAVVDCDYCAGGSRREDRCGFGGVAAW